MKEILLSNGFVYTGNCKVCDGNAELYEKDGIKCKIKPKIMKFWFVVNNNTITGRSNELQAAIEKFIPKKEGV